MPTPPLKLVGFDKTKRLAPGQSAALSFIVTAEHHAVVQSTGFDDTLATKMNTFAQHRRPLNHAAGFDHAVGPDHDVGIDVDLTRVDEAHPGVHVALVDAAPHRFGCKREVSAVVDSEALLAVFEQKTFDAEPVLHRVLDDVGEVQLPLLVVGLEACDALADELGTHHVDAGISFRDFELFGSRVLHFDHAFDLAARVAVDAPGDGADRSQHQEIG